MFCKQKGKKTLHVITINSLAGATMSFPINGHSQNQSILLKWSWLNLRVNIQESDSGFWFHSFMNLGDIWAKFKVKSLHFICFKSEESEMWYILHFLYFPFISFNTHTLEELENGTISVRALDGPKASIMPSTYHSASPPGTLF